MNPGHQMNAVREAVDAAYRNESRRVFATLVRLLGDFDLAEDVLQDAFTAAVEQWPVSGIPKNISAWLISAGRFKAIDRIRRQSKLATRLNEIALQQSGAETQTDDDTQDGFADDQLRLIFTCCHPALSELTHVALTLREVCGLTTEEIASAFLSTPSTVAQRIVRGKSKIRDAKIPYEIPSVADLPARIASVLAVVYLVFNEGYSASAGDSLTRADLSQEAIRLGRLLHELLPQGEVIGLLALMLLQESRHSARTSASGDLILLEDQDRTMWNQAMIEEGTTLVERAIRSGHYGAYTIQAAIAAVHAEASSADTTDWNQIVALYNVLISLQPSPVVELNRAVAIAMRDGALAGLEQIDSILNRGDLTDYHLAHAARADLCRRLGYTEAAIASYHRAWTLTALEPERRFLERRMSELKS
jgi:RNA polymerase sigma-70 factor (ECF subfamily)